jgi:hypothetical protein
MLPAGRMVWQEPSRISEGLREVETCERFKIGKW